MNLLISFIPSTSRYSKHPRDPDFTRSVRWSINVRLLASPVWGSRDAESKAPGTRSGDVDDGQEKALARTSRTDPACEQHQVNLAGRGPKNGAEFRDPVGAPETAESR